MFDKYIIQDNANAVHAAHIVERAQEKLGDKLESISRAEIESKDRVDITLQEYLDLRNKVEKYEEKISRLGKLIIRLGIPAEVIDKIDLDSVEVFTNDDIRYFRRKYMIKFNTEGL